MKTYFALTDIHGRELNLGMFENKGFDINNEEHVIILMGDYFDRWDKNLEVYEFCTEKKKLLGDRLILLKGNHDEMLEDFLESMIKLTTVEDGIDYDEFLYNHFIENGGKITLNQLINKGIKKHKKYHPAIIRRAKEVMAFLKSLEYQHMDAEKRVWFTHAGSENGMISVWTRDEVYKNEERPYATFIGHTPHAVALHYDTKNQLGIFNLNGDVYQTAVCNVEVDNGVYMIDNGEGNNIVVI